MRTAVWGILLMCGSAAAAEAGRTRPLVGAIRWDAWTGGWVTEQVVNTLGPKKYHDRLPWFAEVIDDKTVKIDGSRQAIMDREIELAAGAGLDYWAFLIYPESSPMSTAIKQYLRSPKRKRLGFCLILHGTLKVGDAQWPKERARVIALLREPGYQTVLNGRPLVYAFTGKDFPFERFTEFLTSARRAGLNPYCVFMGWDPASDFKKVSKKGFDAVSAYAKEGRQARFSDLVKAVEKDYWRKAAKAKVPYVPLVTTGWDKNPRKDNPVSWEKGHSYHQQKVFPSRATPAEISSHLSSSLAFAQKHPKTCVAGTIIIYAWNEYDEGGWLAPTRRPDGKPDTTRLDAIRRVLKRNDTTQPTDAGDGKQPRLIHDVGQDRIGNHYRKCQNALGGYNEDKQIVGDFRPGNWGLMF